MSGDEQPRPFIVGTLVTLLVVSSMALLFWGAVLDGRDEDAMRAAEREASESKRLRAVDAA